MDNQHASDGASLDIKLNPKFPYRMERVKWYLMFMLMEQIISVDEFDDLYSRLPEEFK